MALERVPADIRQQGGVARMSDPNMIKAIMDAVSIPVMAKVRIGHFVEAQVSPLTLLIRFWKQLGSIILMKVRF
jgi:pyridoxal biosynthesis lyase PdxS